MKVKTVLNGIYCGCILAMIPVGAQAQDSDGFSPPDLTKESLTSMIAQIKVDQDQAITGLTLLLNNFSAADQDSSGTLSHEEVLAYAEANGITLPDGPGRHGPKSLSKEELSNLSAEIAKREGAVPEFFAQMLANFATVDTNGDGLLSPQEQRQYAVSSGLEMPRPHRDHMR